MKTEEQLKIILKILKGEKWTIGVMESCTGGAIANSLTNIPGASEVFLGGKVTYSDEAKVEAGVDRKVIDRYSVFSIEVAEEMAKKIKGNLGIGVTGNLPGEVFVALRIKDKIVSEKVKVESDLKDKIKARIEMKREVVEMIWKMVAESL